jgi:hypothetical protein
MVRVVPFDFAQGRLYGTWWVIPALACWATSVRPFRGWESNEHKKKPTRGAVWWAVNEPWSARWEPAAIL